MKNKLRKLVAPAAFLCAILMFAGCYSQENLWAAKKGELTLPTGGYIYYLSSAAGTARTKVSTEEDVLKSQIDGKDAETWVRDTALNSARSFFYVNDKFSELGLSLNDNDLATITSTTDSMWSYYSRGMEPMGVSKQSFNTIYSEYTMKQSKIFDSIYGVNGSKAISDADLSAYYQDKYFAYEYFTVTVPTVKNDTESSESSAASTEIDETAKADLMKTLEGYASDIKAGKMTVTQAAEKYAADAKLENNTYIPYVGKIESAYGNVAQAAVALKDNEVSIIESTTSTLVLMKKLPIADKAAEMLATASSRENILADMKWKEFVEELTAEAATVEGVEWNNKVINAQKASTFLSGDYKKGTSSTSSATESSSAIK